MKINEAEKLGENFQRDEFRELYKFFRWIFRVAASEASNAKLFWCSAALHKESERKSFLNAKKHSLGTRSVAGERRVGKSLSFQFARVFVPSFAQLFIISPRNQVCGRFKAFGLVFKIYAPILPK
jgi:hypothetical protein